jgi:hypothetical protein
MDPARLVVQSSPPYPDIITKVSAHGPKLD